MIASRAFGISARNDCTSGSVGSRAERRRHCDRDLADRLVALRGEVFLGLRDEVQDALAMLEQAPAGFGQLHAAAVAQQQCLAQLRLQRAHLTAQRRLRDAEHQRRLAEAAVLGDMNEVLELVQLHAAMFARAMPKLNSS